MDCVIVKVIIGIEGIEILKLNFFKTFMNMISSFQNQFCGVYCFEKSSYKLNHFFTPVKFINTS